MLVFDTPWTQTAIGFINGPPEDLAELIRPGGEGGGRVRWWPLHSPVGPPQGALRH